MSIEQLSIILKLLLQHLLKSEIMALIQWKAKNKISEEIEE